MASEDIKIRLHAPQDQLSQALVSWAGRACDVTLIGDDPRDNTRVSDNPSEDTRRLSVHSWVLARASELLSSLVKEVPRCQEVRVSVPGVRADTLSHIVTLLYSGVLTVTHREAGEVIEATKLLGISNISKSPNSSEDTERKTRVAEFFSSEDTHREAREVVETAKLLGVENNIVLPPKQRYYQPQNELLQLSGGINFDLNGLSQIDNDNVPSDEDGEQLLESNEINEVYSSDDEDDKASDDDDGVNGKIERLMSLVTTENESRNGELEELVNDLFFEDHKAKYHKVSGEVKMKKEKGKKQNLSKVCPKCGKEFSSRPGMLYHHRLKHTRAGRGAQTKPRLCPECGKEFRNQQSYADHRRHSHNMKMWHCDQCDYEGKQLNNLTAHKKVYHMEKAFVCDQCSKRFSVRHSLDQHIRTAHEGFRLKCPECDFKTANKQNLKKHHDMIHLKVKFPCNLCPKEYSNRSAVKTHTKRDHGVDLAKYKKPFKLEDGSISYNKP